MRDISERSRASLKETIFRRRSSLTAAETSFLLELIERGDEIEVQLAHENLLDEDLFFPVVEPQLNSANNIGMLDDSETGWRSDLIQVGRERDFSSAHSLGGDSNPPIEITNLQKVMNASGGNILTGSAGGGAEQPALSLTSFGRTASSLNMGSERRIQALQQRRNSLLHGKMWKAHENGIAVSNHASQRSVQARAAHAKQQQHSNIQQQTNTIFRHTGGRNHNKATMDDTKSDNLRRTSGNGVRNNSLSSSSGGHNHRKPVLRRMQSEGSRKSVTFARIPKPQRFGGTPMRDDSVNSIPSLHHGHPISSPQSSSGGGDTGGNYERRNSVSSIPSIHHGHLVWTSPYEPGRPYERSNSIGSLPSIHHAHPIGSPFERRNSMESIGSYRRRGSMGSLPDVEEYGRRDSMGSIPSIHHGHPVFTAPYEYERPKERSQSIGSIPSIHHGHPITSPRSSLSGGVPSLHRTTRDDTETSDISASENVVAYDGDFIFADEKKMSDATATASPPVIKEVVIPTTRTDQRKSRLDDNSDQQQQQLLDATKLLHTNDPDAPHQLLLDSLSKSASSEIIIAPQRPVLMREASSNNYKGEGVEVADWLLTERQIEPAASVGESLVSFGDGLSSIKTSNSFDERMSYRRVGSIFRRAMNRRRSVSEDSAPHAGIILGGNRLLIKESSSVKDLVPTDDDDSWKLGDDEEDYYDSWKVIEDEYANGYGGGGTLPFRILGTSADDVDAHPHVLSPPLMESLQAFLPASQTGSNFWMKYSLVRDGAAMHTFLQYARGAKYSILAIETLEGEVFGAFTSEPWRKNWNYFGSGESFLWRMRKSRREKCHSIIDQAQMESEIDVYPFTGENHCIQLCTHDKIAVGGGNVEPSSSASSPERQQKSGVMLGTGAMQRNEQLVVSESLSNDSYQIPDHAWGFGLTVEEDFLHGTTSPCVTFASPSLSMEHPRGDVFEIINLELYTLTPCDRLEDAEKLELGKLFLERHSPKM